MLFIYLLPRKPEGHLKKEAQVQQDTTNRQNSKASFKKRKEEKALQQIAIKSQTCKDKKRISPR